VTLDIVILTLDCCSNTFSLETIDIRCSELAGQVWIFGERFEVSPTKWSSVQTYSWRQKYMCRSGLGFISEMLANFEKKLSVPSSSQRDSTGKQGSLAGSQKVRYYSRRSRL
jgi:hypothetical protein